ncbi:DNA polymerase III subunit alpha [Haloplasma contractile]|uniref:DNA polymerase III subunit alpha n=1 Tax=Haloplasma contractile SSD-17B TaxID=1033810 RepID=F7PV57_9MOLU|nr:DNA polymerase III subunit alpha [Haloplasma contractile]ERJ10975.1 DNA polymerase III subunit alpha protein [Haloplasma contractile SSD-17B]
MYTQIFTKTMYTLLGSSVKIDQLILKAKEFGFKSLAITDHNNMYGAIKFYKACIKHNITPIIGLLADIESTHYEKTSILLLAKTNIGYENLMKISSVIQISELGLITQEYLKKYNQDLICITPGSSGEIERLLKGGNQEEAEQSLGTYNSIFNDVYLSLHPESDTKQTSLNQKIASLGTKTNTKLVALNEVMYLNKDDYEVVDYLKAIDRNEKITDYNGQTSNVDDAMHYLMEPDEFNKYFQDYKKAIDHTLRIAKECQVDINFDEYHLPKYEAEQNIKSDDFLKILCKKGLMKRIGKNHKLEPVYVKRLKYELDIINKMGFSDYFLIVWDFVKYAKKNDILVGPGRGSAAGSLVSYVLGITNVDPIQYNLLFERFLNPERVTMPDIDLDFPDDKRDQVIKYVKDLYGKYNVSYIVTFGTFLSRSALRDVARVMNISSVRIDEIIKHIPSSQVQIKQAIEESVALQDLIGEYPQIKRLLMIASKIEGLPRHTSTHAAGVIISGKNLTTLTPLQKGLNDIYQTQYEAKDLEAIGLVKMDFLGLRNLTIITEIIKRIEQDQNKTINLSQIPLNDRKTFNIISRGDTTGIFQLESDGMRAVLRRMNASTLEDIIASNALFRPGPMENIPHYIERKKGNEPIEYPHDDLIPILKPTYGIIVYQEQILQIARKVAGYSLGRADILRRAVGKKLLNVLEKERSYFISGSEKRGYTKETAEILFNYIVKFANYGFNRSHSVAYSMIAYQLAYLKANHILQFMAVLLGSVIGSETQTYKYVKESKRHGIKILAPSINKSLESYKCENNNSIRMPLLCVRNVGYNTYKSIKTIREESGRFTDYYDFVKRTREVLSERVVESLIDAGALDEFGMSKKVLIENYETVIDYCKFNSSGFFNDKVKYTDIDKEYETEELMEREKKAIGFYLNTHPILNFTEYITKHKRLRPHQAMRVMDETNPSTFVGYIEQIRTILTKKGDKMAFLTISDDLRAIDCVVFPKTYESQKNNIASGTVCELTGRITERDGKLQLVLNFAKRLHSTM